MKQKHFSIEIVDLCFIAYYLLLFSPDHRISATFGNSIPGEVPKGPLYWKTFDALRFPLHR